MKISTKGRYAIRLMLDIAAQSGDGNISIKDVAKRQEISIKYLEQIVNTLSKAGFLKSQRGAQGGYKLTRKPEEYTIGEILRITEGSMVPIECLEYRDCPRKPVCLTFEFWAGLYDIINNYIDSYTLADLLDRRADGFDYCI